MDLFKIKRYGAEENCSPDEQLAALKAKIEERRKRLSNVCNKQEKIKLKYKKENIEESNVQNAENKSNNNSLDNISLIKKKRKKRNSLEEEKILISQKNDILKDNFMCGEDNGVQEETTLNLDSIQVDISSIEEDDFVQLNEKNVSSIEGNDEKKNPDSEHMGISDQSIFPVLGKQKHVKLVPLKRALPRWLAEPVSISANIDKENKSIVDSLDYITKNTINNLKSSGIEHLFPVQTAVITYMHSQSKMLNFPPRDICVEAPTGSGKTLSYVLPVIESLTQYIVKELYCLVVLPSKDLAIQVKQVFSSYLKGTNIKVGLICGVKTLEKERSKLVCKGPQGYMNMVEILVATPGRLVDHLKTTSGFSLKHLRFLVIDEADRLLSQDYSGWLELVLESAQSLSYRKFPHPLTVRTFQKNIIPLQKLLFSATLTQNPEKLAPLRLYNPILFISKCDNQKNKKDGSTENKSEFRFIVPEQLVEKMVIVKEELKPLVIVHLMLKLKYKRILCFTKSIEATHRLHLLLQSIGGFTVAEFSSNLTETQRKGIIRDFKNGSIDALISSDAMARGMDIDNVNMVVNYDSPANSKTYVHRVGRTARAGNRGEALTILTKKEVYHFKKMSNELSGVVLKMKIKDEDLLIYEHQYQKALSSLQEKISSEKRVNLGRF
ncbi:ATP-dependent RNA helicase DDX51 [Hydra vulgaris]|uniref:ATP-dependent RNA helicase n=1 Tax=Hydra vulgaris TaxID=6087 RepID=A0ABM4B5P8_HYDVU